MPADLPRVDFFHWVLVDLPPRCARSPKASSAAASRRAASPGPQSRCDGARHGLNDYTGWFAGDPEMAGDYFGYDGPFPPFNDSLVHHYVFTLYALDVPRRRSTAPSPARGAPGDRRHVLAEATFSAPTR